LANIAQQQQQAFTQRASEVTRFDMKALAQGSMNAGGAGSSLADGGFAS
jgi:hypothetical protein